VGIAVDACLADAAVGVAAAGAAAVDASLDDDDDDGVETPRAVGVAEGEYG
jgi:hypothetical protein